MDRTKLLEKSQFFSNNSCAFVCCSVHSHDFPFFNNFFNKLYKGQVKTGICLCQKPKVPKISCNSFTLEGSCPCSIFSRVSSGTEAALLIHQTPRNLTSCANPWHFVSGTSSPNSDVPDFSHCFFHFFFIISPYQNVFNILIQCDIR